MQTLIKICFTLSLAGLLQQCSWSQNQQVKDKSSIMDSIKKNNPVYSNTDTGKINLTETEWKKILPPDVYNIARQKGTERPWTSIFEHSKEIGTYYCAACGNALFKSDTKFDSGCGWPSFYEPISKGSIIYTPDDSHGITT
jgi:peptide-methionine (R)-S-oxide reductase